MCSSGNVVCVRGREEEEKWTAKLLFGWVGNKIRRRRLNPLTTASVGVRGRHFAQLVASPCVMTTQRVLTCIVTLNSSFLSIWLFSRKRPRTKFQKKNKNKTRKFCETRRCVRDRSSEPSVAIRTDGQHDTHSVWRVKTPARAADAAPQHTTHTVGWWWWWTWTRRPPLFGHRARRPIVSKLPHAVGGA